MLEKTIVLAISYLLTLAPDARKLRRENIRTKAIYWMIVGITVYYSADYFSLANFPTQYWLVDRVLTVPSRAIFAFLNVKPA